jgi:hypothetical protein
MTPSQVEAVTIQYDGVLDNLGVAAIRHSDKASLNKDEQQEHARWMCQEMLRMIADEGVTEKIHRWLGFVQGVLHCTGVYSINDMRDHNRAS